MLWDESVTFKMPKVDEMRNILISLLWFGLFSCQATPESSDQSKDLIGLVTAQQFLQSNPTFAKNYRAYQPSQNELNAAKALKGKSLTVLFGTWCHDSQREVPRLLKVLDMADSQLTDLTLIAVNHNKQEPSGIYKTLGLRYTPTFVLFDGSTELGRVIEKPQLSLGEDLAALL